MKDPLALIDAILDVYDRLDFKPSPAGDTYCNLAVHTVCTELGYTALAGMTADQIVAFLTGNSDWSEVPIEKAQDLSNEGSLLIAGLDSKALGQAHGHVVVIRPGKPCFSGKWGATPRCLNIGAHNFIARAPNGAMTNQPVGINEAFISLPKIYVLRSTL